MLNLEIIYSGTDSDSLTEKKSYTMNSPTETNCTFRFAAQLYIPSHQKVNWK